MKKLISTIATLALSSSTALPLIACSPDDSLKIAFVPSKDSIEIMKIVKPLEVLLKNKIKELDPDFKRNVKITTTTDYQAAGQALHDGKTALAFLPMGTYIDYRGKEIAPGNYADAAPLVIAERNAMRPDTESKVSDRNISTDQQMVIIKHYNQIANDNGGIIDHNDAYQKLYHQTKEANFTSFYRAQVIVSNKFLVREKVDIKHLFDNAATYKTEIKRLILAAESAPEKNKIQLLASNTSGAGVIYPVQWMLDMGIQDSKIADILREQSRVESFTAAAQNVANDACDITFGYTDIRADAEHVQTDYQNTTMIGLTSGVPNDGISYSKKAIKDQKLLAAIRQAFKELISDTNNANIFNVYSHINYITPGKDATVDKSLAWEIDENNKYNIAIKEINDAITLIKNS